MDESSKTDTEHVFVGVRSDLSYFYFSYMRIPNSNPCTPGELLLIDFIRDCEPRELAKALREVHEMALYHTDIPIEECEKLHLMHVKLLAEELDKL